MSKRVFLLLILVALILCFLPAVSGECSGEIDMAGVVSWVINGDTFDVTSGDRIRLADVDAPEYYDEGYNESKYFLKGLVFSKTVYLDVDDITGKDPYNRSVCVIYVDHNATHVMNVNKALLVEGVAVIDNYTNNEFDPYTWSLHCPMESIRGMQAFSRHFQLLADFDILNSTYQTLLSTHAELLGNYTELMIDYAELQGDYTILLSDYASIQSSYHVLNSTLANLQSTIDVLNSTNNDLLMNYSALQSSHDQLQEQYDQLSSTYNTLQDSFDHLQLDKEAALVEAETMRNLVYAFLTLTIVIASVSTFAVMGRPKATVEEAKATEMHESIHLQRKIREARRNQILSYIVGFVGMVLAYLPFWVFDFDWWGVPIPLEFILSIVVLFIAISLGRDYGRQKKALMEQLKEMAGFTQEVED